VESDVITIKPKDTDWDDEYSQMTHLHEPLLSINPMGQKIPTGPELK
jgi:hypothetical protein